MADHISAHCNTIILSNAIIFSEAIRWKMEKKKYALINEQCKSSSSVSSKWHLINEQFSKNCT